MIRSLLQCATFSVAALAALTAAAENPPAAAAKPSLFRASTLQKLEVRNAAGEDLGNIQDMVIDANTGKVTYVALDFGGFLGIGDKLFAVPWHSFKYHQDGSREYLVLNVTKEQLKNAPGFDKNRWPNMADPMWSRDVDTFYGPARTAARP